MQILNVKQASKAQLTNRNFHQLLIESTEKKVEKTVETTKRPSFNRFLEAYGDCI